jgi:hypothetical protein
MKLFKRGPFRSKQAPKEEDTSLGSNLSEADRFDILIPLRSNRVLPLFGRDECSEVSSITTDDRKDHPGAQKRTKKSPRGVVTACCYGCATTKANNSVAATAKGGASEDTDTTPLVPISTISLFDFACCGSPDPTEEEVKRMKRTRGSRNASVVSLVPTVSLFDSVMSDDEDRDPADVITVSSHKRRLWKIRGLPWRRNRYDM